MRFGTFQSFFPSHANNFLKLFGRIGYCRMILSFRPSFLGTSSIGIMSLIVVIEGGLSTL
jgi:hypothetical protein